ncbi:MAG: tRNA (adenosine(37)-N6)-dimethylallyltransferase MiaA [Prevotella sp.]|nr:tRNA (adenosine(37)-N6)-dimethylallyltransferase MiaA [Prevotella sp.]
MILIVITGPTGVGKTDLSIELAEHYGTEIINADSRQIYAEMSIGTAAPTKEQMERVKHHFVATKHIGDYYSASMYEQEVLKLLDADGQENEIMILSGGSMLYIDAVCNGIDDIPTIRDDIRQMMKQRLANEGLEALVEELRQLDPEYGKIVDEHNTRRVIHALEICHQTGSTYTSFRTGKKKQRPFRIIKIGLTCQRELLYERINQRVVRMIEAGLVEEVRSLLPYRYENALNTVGYKEIFKYIDGEISLDEAIRQIQSNSRQYARKQLTWYKRDEEMKWFENAKAEDIIEYINNRIGQ